mgnify:CR=1 FL=1
MREYKIYKNDLWFGIYKKKEENWLMQIWFLDWKGKWTLNRSYARTFYHREDAAWILSVMRMKDGKDAD